MSLSAVESKIADALLTHLGELVFSPPLRVAYPDVELDPPVAPTAPWLRGSLLPKPTAAPFLNHASVNFHGGILQVDVFYPENSGEIRPLEIAGSIIQHFKRGTVILSEDLKIRITVPPYRMGIQPDPPWSMTPVRIEYLCYSA